jgi:SAM-dependent methyltransferase
MTSADSTAIATCLACGAPIAGGEKSLVCTACGLHLERTPSGVLAIPDEFSVSYPDTGADEMMTVEESSFWFAHRNEVIALVLDRFPPAGSLWDVGGANGFQALDLQNRGYETIVLEPGMAACVHAAERGVRRVVRGTLESLNLTGGSLGGASMFDVVEHLPDPVAVLSEVRRVLRPDGHVYITVPAYQALWSDEDEHVQHHRRYTRKLLTEHLTAAGLRTEYMSHFFRPLVVPIFLIRAVPYRLKLRKRTGPNLSHHGPGGAGQRVVERLLARELDQLRSGSQLPYGGSIIAVARPA